MINTWFVNLDAPGKLSPEKCLSVDEKERAGRYCRSFLGKRFSVGRAALRHILAACLGCLPKEVHFSYGARGRPECAGMSFNVTNSGSFAFVAVAGRGRIGIDAEECCLDRDHSGIEEYFSRSEQAVLACLDERLRKEAFYALWVRKEAVMKACGMGIAMGLENVVVDACRDGRLTRVTGGEFGGTVWHTPLFACHGCLLSIATEFYEQEIFWHALNSEDPGSISRQMNSQRSDMEVFPGLLP